MDRVSAFMSERTPRRLLAVAVFVGLLVTFRHLALLFVFFVGFERALGASARMLEQRAKLSFQRSVLCVAGLFLLTVGILAALGVGRTIKAFADVEGTLPERLETLRYHPLVEQVEEHLGGTENLLEGAKHYAGSALGAASAVGHFFVHVLVGFILAVIFQIEIDELRGFAGRIDRRSLVGTMARWVGHVADATLVTIKLQLIVATFNALTTLPVLLLLGVTHAGSLMVIVFVSALVPVVGNLVSGTLLSLLAYDARGWVGVGIFVSLTFVLHKLESYYLNPRLTAKHVQIPGFLLIVSLIACEHLFGFAGFFLSFPLLFVVSRIRRELLEEDAIMSGTELVLSDSLDQLPESLRAPLEASDARTSTTKGD